MQTLTLTNSTGGAAQSNFQVLLQLLSDDASFWSHLDGGASATGHDVHVQDGSGNELSFWIEQLDTTKQARAHLGQGPVDRGPAVHRHDQPALRQRPTSLG